MTIAMRQRIGRASRLQWVAAAVVVAVFLIGAAVRLRMLFRLSPLFFGTYDDGVHFTAAASFVHGRLLYGGTLFLQPPGIVLAVSPFALLADVVGDAKAFAVGRIAFALIGALNGALVAVLLRRFGLLAMTVGGLLYAVSFPAAYDERTITLEIIGGTGVLAALALLDIGQRRGSARWFVLAGVAAGVAVDFKIWYLVPFLVIAVTAGRRAPLVVVGTAIAGLAGYLPFFIAAPAAMWKQVVLAQLGRPKSTGTPTWTRLRSILGVQPDGATGHIWALQGTAVVTGLLVLVLLLAVATATVRGARRYVVLLAACGAVLLGSPSYFQHYAVLTAAPLALVAGVGTARAVGLLGERGRSPAVGVVAVLAVALLATAVNLRALDGHSGQRVAPLAALRAASARIHGCIVADDPTILVLMNRLTPDLQDGCRVEADPSGYGYVLAPDGRQVFRNHNPLWQREALDYLDSARAYLLVRGPVFGLTSTSLKAVHRDPVLFELGRFVIRTND